MSLLRYAKDGIKTARGPLQFGRVGMDGLPFRAQPDALYTNREVEQKAYVSTDVGIRILDLSDPEQLKEYQDISEKGANGLYYITEERVEFIPAMGKFIVLVKWMMPALEMPSY